MSLVVGIVAKPKQKEACQLAGKVLAWLREKGCDYRIGNEFEVDAPKEHLSGKIISRNQLASECDAIVVLGGDGTFISVARHAKTKSPLIVGVNMGTLGFLTEITIDELFDTLEDVLANKAKTERRNLLEAKVVRNKKIKNVYHALNDLVITKQALARIFGMELYVDGLFAAMLRGDGVIVSTPVGSTAYSMSAGGSIVHPQVAATLVTPICPHSLTSRPLVVPDVSKLVLKLPSSINIDSEGVYFTVDGQEGTELCAGDEIRISKSDVGIEVVKSKSRNYFQVLGTKLQWAASTVNGK